MRSFACFLAGILILSFLPAGASEPSPIDRLEAEISKFESRTRWMDEDKESLREELLFSDWRDDLRGLVRTWSIEPLRGDPDLSRIDRVLSELYRLQAWCEFHEVYSFCTKDLEPRILDAIRTILKDSDEVDGAWLSILWNGMKTYGPRSAYVTILGMKLDDIAFGLAEGRLDPTLVHEVFVELSIGLDDQTLDRLHVYYEEIASLTKGNPVEVATSLRSGDFLIFKITGFEQGHLDDGFRGPGVELRLVLRMGRGEIPIYETPSFQGSFKPNIRIELPATKLLGISHPRLLGRGLVTLQESDGWSGTTELDDYEVLNIPSQTETPERFVITTSEGAMALFTVHIERKPRELQFVK